MDLISSTLVFAVSVVDFLVHLWLPFENKQKMFLL